MTCVCPAEDVTRPETPEKLLSLRTRSVQPRAFHARVRNCNKYCGTNMPQAKTTINSCLSSNKPCFQALTMSLYNQQYEFVDFDAFILFHFCAAYLTYRQVPTSKHGAIVEHAAKAVDTKKEDTTPDDAKKEDATEDKGEEGASMDK